MSPLRRRCTSLAVCLIFASLELLSAAPALHRHDGGADAFLSHASSAAAGALAVAGLPAGPQIAQPAEPGDPAPRECPACRISGLSAIATCGIPISAPVTQPEGRAAVVVRAAASPVVASLRGRAPPLS
jgi:hypothetical protein